VANVGWSKEKKNWRWTSCENERPPTL